MQFRVIQSPLLAIKNEMIIASEEIKNYFRNIEQEVARCYEAAAQVRKKGYDPEDEVNIFLAKNMAERVMGLISVASPQLLDKKINAEIIQRIQELEKEYSLLDWRVALKIAEEVAKEKFCRFSNKLESMEIGIRIGFAYLTLGIVSAPLEGFTNLKIKKRRDGKEYFSLQFAGPIRGAGGTGSATPLLIADYIRTKLGYAAYDPDEREINRWATEIHDYHDRVTNLQYHPSDEEIKFLARHIPVEIDGDPTEEFEVSNYKDLPRIETNLLRGGFCLVLAEGLAQKAPKIWKRLSKWGKDLGLEWDFLEEFLNLQKKAKAQEKTREVLIKERIKPNYTYITDLVAGRPILAHPLAVGGFRLRYGRTRTSGFATAALNPATQYILNKYIAIGTQLKTERPSKGASVSICGTIEGPIVKLKDQSVVQLNSVSQAKEVDSEIEKILFLGDILSDYGDFSEFGHVLVPCGYCPEWWLLELEKAAVDALGSFDLERLSNLIGVDSNRLKELFADPLTIFPTPGEAIKFSREMKIPLHPAYTYHWKLIDKQDLLLLKEWLLQGSFKKDCPEAPHKFLKIILPLNSQTKKAKKVLENIGFPHLVINKENVVIEANESTILAHCLNFENQEDIQKLDLDSLPETNALEIINLVSKIKLRDKSGTFIGARMGRPEKAKQRKMTGTPHAMFPVGQEGDRLRSFQAALKAGKIEADFPLMHCSSCQKETIYRTCENCGQKTIQRYFCRFCGLLDEKKCRHEHIQKYKTQSLDINYYFNNALKKLQISIFPDIIKGIRGTSNKDHIPEHLAKGILRAKHGVYVNKDGTIRYDCTEQPITHFKPKEINTPIERLKKLGYQKDIYEKELVDENQILELKPQDVILPGYDSLEDSARQVLFQVASFIDDLLIRLYCAPPFYNLSSEEDLIGHLIIGLAPHTSAGLVGRIIGFSQIQSFLAHPMFHAGLRRDCFTYETRIPVYNGISWKNVQIGEFVEKLNPQKIVDNFGTKLKEIKNFKTLGFNPQKKKIEIVPIKEFTKHTPAKILEIKTKQGRKLKVTADHKFLVNKSLELKRACQLKINDKLLLPYTCSILEKDIKKINLLEYLCDKPNVCIRGVKEKFKSVINALGGIAKVSKKINLSNKLMQNYILRDSVPAHVLNNVLQLAKLDLIKFTENAYLGTKRDAVKIPAQIPLCREVLELIGLYIAEGYARKKDSGKGFYQIYIAAEKEDIRAFIKNTVKKYFGLVPTEKKLDRVVFSSRIFYNLFVDILQTGSFAYDKKIPPLFLGLPKEKLGHLLRGYYEGDGSVSEGELRVSCDTVSQQLIEDLKFIFSRYGIFVKTRTYSKEPGPRVREFYIRKKRKVPKFTITKLTASSNFVYPFNKYIGFLSDNKKRKLNSVVRKVKPYGMKVEKDGLFVYDPIISIEEVGKETTYCLNVKHHNVFANGILTQQCDGDEAAIILLMDALLNFSRQYLPESRGAKHMDSPLVLTAILNPTEIDDQVHGLGIAWKYSLELYQAALEYKNPWDVKIEQIKNRLNTPDQYQNIGFTHPVENFNHGIQCSAYKTLPTMKEKLLGQMEIAQKVRAVDKEDVAKLVIEKHFLKDIRGNLRKFSTQQFRCTKCNEKYRRPPLSGKCSRCGNNLLFTISEGSVTKYLEYSLDLARNYDFSPYLKQSLEIVQENIHLIFGKEKEKQVGLKEWFGK